MSVSNLATEFPREAVHWRVQGQPYPRDGSYYAMALAYIDARDVMDKLDAAVGPENWQDSYTETPSGRVICTLSIRIDGEWVSKSDGAGGTQVEAEKGGVSDALKRAAVKWGIGRYLYRLDSPWVRCEVKKKGDKVYWKKWAEDPWLKVKRIPYHASQAAQPEPRPDPGASFEAEVSRAVDAIACESSLESLGAYWADLVRRAKGVAADRRVIAAKDRRKADLTPTADIIGDEIPY